VRKTLSENLKRISKAVLSDKSTNVNKISAVLYSVSDPTFNLTLEEVELSIHQDPVNHYADVIKIFFSLSLEDYIKTLKVYQDLRCNLFILNHYETNTGDFQEKPGVKIDRMLIFENKDDLFKTFQKSDIMSDDQLIKTEAQTAKRMVVHGELIDDLVFEARKQTTSFVCRNGATVEQVLHFLAGRLNPKFKCILAPDNETKYDNLVVPGMLSFPEVLQYIDKRYGIYNYGLGYYWTEDTIFIYPLYNTNPEISPYVVHIYFVGENNMAGGQNYHTYENDCYHILTNHKPTSSQLMEKGAENIGNGFIVQRSSLIFDKWRVQEEGDFTIIKDGLIRMQVDNPNTMSKFSHKLKFVYGEDKLAECRASLSIINGTVTNIKWDHAVPFIIKPGWKLVYHYDGKETYETKTACCLRASYQYKCVGRSGMDRLYSCSGDITLFTE